MCPVRILTGTPAILRGFVVLLTHLHYPSKGNAIQLMKESGQGDVLLIEPLRIRLQNKIKSLRFGQVARSFVECAN
jgi:hypothetical protein